MGIGIQTLTRTADRIELIAPTDDAVDQSMLARWEGDEAAMGGRDDWASQPSAQSLARFRAYCAGQTRDVGALPMLPGVDPVRLIVRPLNSRELALSGVSGRGNAAAWAYDTVRLGLVEARGLEWRPTREDYHGIQALTLDCVSMLPFPVVQFLATHILTASRLPPF